MIQFANKKYYTNWYLGKEKTDDTICKKKILHKLISGKRKNMIQFAKKKYYTNWYLGKEKTDDTIYKKKILHKLISGKRKNRWYNLQKKNITQTDIWEKKKQMIQFAKEKYYTNWYLGKEKTDDTICKRKILHKLISGKRKNRWYNLQKKNITQTDIWEKKKQMIQFAKKKILHKLISGKKNS